MIESLIVFLGLHSSVDYNSTADYLAHVRNPETLEYLYQVYSDYAINPDKLLQGGLTENKIKENLKRIADRLELVNAKTYIMYEHYSSSKQLIKGVQLTHDNDVLLGDGPIGYNQDRDYTGGIRLEFSTDHFKSRFFNVGWLFKGLGPGLEKNRDKRKARLYGPRKQVLTYQSIAVGGYGYTPYIRYRNNIELVDSLHLHDRPFGSFVYIDRTKYRLWPSGLVRHQGQVQIGQTD